jgi:hypothetical protein
MNKFYNISLIAVLCLVVGGLGASEDQEKPFFSEQVKQRLKRTAETYALTAGGVHWVSTVSIAFESAMEKDAITHNKNRLVKEFTAKALSHNKELLKTNLVVGSIILGGSVLCHKYKERLQEWQELKEKRANK